jgi:hypothetical protein
VRNAKQQMADDPYPWLARGGADEDETRVVNFFFLLARDSLRGILSPGHKSRAVATGKVRRVAESPSSALLCSSCSLPARSCRTARTWNADCPTRLLRGPVPSPAPRPRIHAVREDSQRDIGRRVVVRYAGNLSWQGPRPAVAICMRGREGCIIAVIRTVHVLGFWVSVHGK